MNIILWFLIYGALWGILYEVGVFVRSIFKNKFIATAIVDFVVFALSGLIFYIPCLNACYGEIRLAYILLFACGFLIERLSLGILVASFIKIIYNIINKIIQKLKTTKTFKKFSK